jgi:protein-tyrosine phosphatase
MYRIITVCTGNICRSPMAEFVLTQAISAAGLIDDVAVDSAGISDWEAGRPIDPRATRRLSLAGLASQAHRARQFEQLWFQDRDLILTLDVDHYDALLRIAPDAAARQKVKMFRSFDPDLAGHSPADQGIYDPWFGGDADFDACWDMIQSAVPGIVDYVRNALDGRR